MTYIHCEGDLYIHHYHLPRLLTAQHCDIDIEFYEVHIAKNVIDYYVIYNKIIRPKRLSAVVLWASILCSISCTMVSQASAHSQVSAHACATFKGIPSIQRLMSRVSDHVAQNCKLCLSAYGHLAGTLWHT